MDAYNWERFPYGGGWWGLTERKVNNKTKLKLKQSGKTYVEGFLLIHSQTRACFLVLKGKKGSQLNYTIFLIILILKRKTGVISSDE